MLHKSVEEGILHLNSLLSQSDISLEAVITVLQNLTSLMRSPEARSNLKIEQWKPIEKLAEEGRQILAKNSFSSDELELMIELLRFLRNSCGGLYENQSYVLNNNNLLDFGKGVLNDFLHKEAVNEITALKIAVQLFGNILASNEHSKPLVWSLFFGESKFRYLLQHKDQSIHECTMMVLYNCMTDENCRCIFNTSEGHEILLLVTNILLFHQIDWGLLFIEHLLTKEDFLDLCYGVLPLKNKLLVLEVMEERLKNTQDDCYFSIPGKSVESLTNLFLKNISQISRNSEIEPAETASILSILCSASISDTYVPILHNSQDLVQTTVETLKCIHLLGKDACNVFSPLADLKKLNDQVKEEIAQHPFHGFKKNLIRLIGNICYNCKAKQDLVRKLDGIPLILDCCKFDAKNPYIMQWCILAIRNLLENNLENQAIVAEMSSAGEVAHSELLSEIGMQIHCVNGNIRLKSTSSAS